MNDPHAPKICIVVLHYKNYQFTDACLDSIRTLDYPNVTTIVIDNASEDGMFDLLCDQNPDMCITQMSQNLGFAGGVNAGIRMALNKGADAILLLNNDAVLLPDCLSKLVAAQRNNPDIGIISPKFLRDHAGGTLAAIGFHVTKFNIAPIGWNMPDTTDTTDATPQFFDAVSGAAMLIQRVVFEAIGKFDERFFFYYEDIDFCVRARQAGFKVAYLPAAVVYHSISAGTQGAPGLKYFYYGRSRQIFFRKHLQGVNRLIYASIEPLQMLRTMRVRWMDDRDWIGALNYAKGVLYGWLAPKSN